MANNPKKPDLSPQPNHVQLDRFKQAARELGCDETGEAFEKAFAKAVPPRERGASAKKPNDPEE